MASRTCNLPDWAIGAGVLRNLVWDELHGYAQRTPARDVDVAYFDAADLSVESEQGWEARLRSKACSSPRA